MAQSNWEADKMLDVYIHDYLLKKKLHASAKAFMTEGKVATDPVAIDAPGGFLFEWWSVFWDIFITRTNAKHSEPAAAYIEAQQLKGREQKQMYMQQLQLLQQRNAQLQRRDPNPQNLGGSFSNVNSEGMMGQPSASLLAMKLYEEQMKHPQGMDMETSRAPIDANRMAVLKSATDHQGQMVQGTAANISAALQQIPSRTPLTADVKTEVNMSTTQKAMPVDPSIYGHAILQSKSGIGSAGLNQGITSIPLKGWPLTGIDHFRPGLVLQRPNMQNQNQIVLASQQQQALAQAQMQSSLGNQNNVNEMDPRRFGGLPRGAATTKDAQSTKNDGSICSPGQSNSPRVKMGQVQQSSSQLQDQLQQQAPQTGRKRKQHSSSGPANSTGTGNTVGPSPNSPPSTHAPGDGITTASASSMQRTNSAQKSMIMYGSDGNGGLASSSNPLEDLERLGDIGSLDDNVESFLSHDGGDAATLYGTVKQRPAEQPKESSKGFTFGEVGCIRKGNSKVTCCHFSSDGKLLASAGHDKKVVLWNMDNLHRESTPEEHKSVITDVRFRPNSTHFATSSVDKSVRLWDAANPSFCLHAYTGHTSAVMSLDFHPRKTELFCFCDNDNEIRYWNINTFSCSHISKGGTAQVRFQPRIGQLLAAASDKIVSIFDVETDKQVRSLEGHLDLVNYICWDVNGDYLASVSQNLVKIWSLTSGECIQELNSNGNQFHSCVFHPTYSTLLVIGGVSSLELWNMAENKSMTVSAHENIISALAQTPVSGLVASASHDSSVKIWK